MDLEDLRKKADSGDPDALIKLAEGLDKAQRYPEATDALSRAANQGSLEARYRVGARLLVGMGAPARPEDGVRLISESAERAAGAAHLLSVLCALGAYVKRDWTAALDLLLRAAELGSASARQELALLSTETRPKGDWSKLRRAIDLAGWCAAPEIRKLSEEPLVALFEDFAPIPICSWLINRARGRLKRAEIYVGVEGGIDEARTNTTAIFNLIETDMIMVIMQARMAAAAGVHLGQLEAMSVLHYAVGQVFSDHFDFVDPRSPHAVTDIARHGQRVITFLLYLNDGYSGGETAFPRLGLSHKARAGQGLFFVNTLPDGSPNLRTLHAGRPPSSGEKWAVTQFVRSKMIIPGTSGSH